MDSSDQAPSPPATHYALLARFENYARVAVLIRAKGHSISGMGVTRWGQEDSIPGIYWDALATCADEALIVGYTACLKMLAVYAGAQARAKQRHRRREDAAAAEAVT